MRNILILIGFLIFTGTYTLYAQGRSGNDRIDFEKIVEDLLPVQEEDFNYSDLYDRLFSLYVNHLDLNLAGREDLQSLYLLSDEQIDRLLEYRQKYGSMLSEYELLTIDGFDRELVNRLLLFIDIGPQEGGAQQFMSKIPSPAQHDLLIRVGRVSELSEGYLTQDSLNRYTGRPWHTMVRYTLACKGSYSLGFTVEQDPGEQLAWEPKAKKYGLDYYSFHAMIENRGIVKRFIVGDFALDFGQGLLFGSGFRTGKGVNAVQGIRRNNLGIKPYRSVFEHRDFSGAALTLSAGHFSFTAFGSYVSRDAFVRNDSIYDPDPYVTYLQNTGLHRNNRELAARNSLTEKTAGINMQFATHNRKFVVGVNGVKTVFSRAVLPDPRKYNQFAFSGNENAVGSVYANVILKNISFFGETGMSESGGMGVVGGVLAGLSSYAELSVVYRNYNRNFHTFYGNAFGEDYRNNNEKGLYMGLKVIPTRNLFFTFFYDRFHFPWLRYRADGPSDGFEGMALADYKPSNSLSFRLVYRVKERELNDDKDQNPFHKLEPGLKQWVRLDMDLKPRGIFSTRSRVMMNSYRFCSGMSKGYLIAQDVSLTGRVLFIRGRVSYFSTDDYDTRQFVYEHDLLYVYSVPFFYGHGWRYYLVGGMHAGPRWTFWFKMAQTRYLDRESVGSGLNEIQGNVKTEYRLQMRIRF